MLTIEQTVGVLNRNRHCGRDTWYVANVDDSQFVISTGPEGGLFDTVAEDAAIIAQYYLDREPGGTFTRILYLATSDHPNALSEIAKIADEHAK